MWAPRFVLVMAASDKGLAVLGHAEAGGAEVAEDRRYGARPKRVQLVEVLLKAQIRRVAGTGRRVAECRRGDIFRGSAVRWQVEVPDYPPHRERLIEAKR